MGMVEWDSITYNIMVFYKFQNREVMSKEQIIDEVYKNYEKITNDFQLENPIDDFIIKTLRGEMIKIETEDGDDYRILTQEEFINKCKTDTEFSEKWGLKIEERELSIQERNEWFQIHLNGNNPFMKSDWKDYELDQQNIPTKLITITYNNETIEVYE
jgi:hypothetical protein